MVIRRPDAQGWACDFRSPVPVTLAWHMGRCGGEQEDPGSSVVTSRAYWWATDSERLCFKRRWRERAENMQWWHLAYVHTHAHAHTHTCYPYIFSFLKTNKQNKMHAISSLVRQVWVRTTVSYVSFLLKTILRHDITRHKEKEKLVEKKGNGQNSSRKDSVASWVVPPIYAPTEMA